MKTYERDGIEYMNFGEDTTLSADCYTHIIYEASCKVHVDICIGD